MNRSIHRLAPLSALLTSLVALPASAQTTPADHFDTSLCSLGHYERYDHTADLNADAYPDLIGYWRSSSQLGGPHYGAIVRGYLGDGAGGFEEVWQVPIDVGHHSVSYNHDLVVGNLNGDNRTDFVFTAAGKTWLYTTDPSDPHGAPSFYGYLNQGGLEISIGDLDANGRDEVVIPSNSTRVIFNYGAHQLTTVTTNINARDDRPPLIGDFNGDGRPDLVTYGNSGIDVTPVAGGTFFTPFTIAYPAHNSTHMCGGDIDGDGDKDIVLFDEPGEEFCVIRRTGPAQFVSEPWLPGGPASDLVDLDGDGDLDGACCGGGTGSGPSANNGASNFRICFNDGTGHFGPSITVAGLGGIQLAGAFDVDGDGDTDLVGGRCILYNLSTVGHTYCAPSTSAPGTLSATGSPSRTRDDLVFEAHGLPGSSFSHAFFGPETQSTSLGAGTICVGGPWVRRMPITQSNSSGFTSFPFNYGALPPHGPGAWAPGETRYFQLWYRDPSYGSNLTNGYALVFAP